MMTMSGREEVDLQWIRKINKRIEDAPQVLVDFAHNYRMSPRSMYSYVNIIKAFLKALDKPVTEMKPLDVSSYINSIGDGVTKKYHASKTFSALKTFFSWLVVIDYINKNPMKGLEKPKLPRKNHAFRTDALTSDELEYFIRNVYSGVGTDKSVAFQKRMRERDIAIVLILVQLGIRVSALRELNVSDLDFNTCTLITTSKGNDSQIYEGVTDLFEKINDWMEKRKVINPTTDALFVTERGNRMSVKSIENLIKKYSEGINKNVTPHKLRATFASLLENQNYTPHEIMLLMGHANISTTFIYLRNKERKTAQAAATMARLCNM